ncbi:MAG TPA: AIR synthase-related protein, partial [Chloroflexota bacterium]
NGFSLIQSLFTDDEYECHEPRLGSSLADALLEPHHCYLDDMRHLIGTGAVHGLAHITGGGIAGNLTRIIPAGLEAVVELPPTPAIFQLLQARGVSIDEMRRVFNMGVGMIAVCDRRILSSPRASYQMIGSVRPTNDTQRRVRFDDRP